MDELNKAAIAFIRENGPFEDFGLVEEPWEMGGTYLWYIYFDGSRDTAYFKDGQFKVNAYQKSYASIMY